MTKPVELNAYLFDSRPHPLSREVMAWMEASARFTGFVETYRDKIRKKIRTNRDPESILDLRGELEAAARLLADRRLEVAYEPYASAKRRGPDFAVTYRANLVFNIEVARLRGEENGGESVPPPRAEERVLRILFNKLGQMQPNLANLLVIRTREELAQAVDLEGLMQAVKRRADGRDPAFYAAVRYPGPAAFYKDFLNLSGIVLWAEAVRVWANKPARPGLEERVLRLVGELLAGSGKG